uniref:Uncharacterized protein n=1 Tax=Rhizophora mucronata TaxID=61149 RepID=A0A2P2QA91_RHIMU
MSICLFCLFYSSPVDTLKEFVIYTSKIWCVICLVT